MNIYLRRDVIPTFFWMGSFSMSIIGSPNVSTSPYILIYLKSIILSQVSQQNIFFRPYSTLSDVSIAIGDLNQFNDDEGITRKIAKVKA